MFLVHSGSNSVVVVDSIEDQQQEDSLCFVSLLVCLSVISINLLVKYNNFI